MKTHVRNLLRRFWKLGVGGPSVGGHRPRRFHPPQLELLEDRTVLTPVTITITRLEEVSNPDDCLIPFACHGGDHGDYFAKVNINNQGEQEVAEVDSGTLCFFFCFDPNGVYTIEPFWRFSRDVDAGLGIVPITISVLDEDGPTTDDDIDINPEGGQLGITLLVDLRTGGWSGQIPPNPGHAPLPPNEGCTSSILRSGSVPGWLLEGSGAANICFDISVGSADGDSDGDGLLDGWERFGVDGNDDGVKLNLPGFGANPYHKDLFLEMDWMPGATPQRSAIQALKQAFALAPTGAGTDASALSGGRNANPNADGQPGINLHVDTGSLMEAGNLVGDNLGGGNQVDLANMSGLNTKFYDNKRANFDFDREWVFRYGLSAVPPANTSGISTGGNRNQDTCDIGFNICMLEGTLHDTNQFWETGGWNGFSVTITGGTGAGQTRAIHRNDATELAVHPLWTIIPDSTSTYRINWGLGGQGELGGNDFIDYNHDGGTIMHEFGHTLNLHHGGFEAANCKPNYVSVMNYYYAFGIPQTNGGPMILDYSPPRFPGGRGVAPLPQLIEDNLLESNVLDVTDNANMMIFVNANGQKVQWPLKGLDRSAPPDGIPDGPDYDADGVLDTAPVTANIDTVILATGQAAACANTTTNSTLTGHDDWSTISLPFRQFRESLDSAVNPVLEPEPTLEELLQLEQELNTTDVEIAGTDSPDPVAQGQQLTYTFTVTDNGPNPGRGLTLTLPLSAGVSFVSASSGQGSCSASTTEVRCDLGIIFPRAPLTVQITIVPFTVGTLSSRATVTTTGIDPVATNNSATVESTVLNVPPQIVTLANSSPGCGGAGEGQTVSVSASFTDPGRLDTHTATIDWGDGNTTGGVVTESDGSGSVTGSHVYAAGGLYTVTVTVVDNNGGNSNPAKTNAMISGAGLRGGVLQIVGTNQANKVQLGREDSGRVTVLDASFLSGVRRFSTAAVSKILGVLCGGDDEASLSGDVATPVLWDGGSGNDRLKGSIGPSILLGADGNDRLEGGKARDLLIGGLGADQLDGKDGDDILIAGRTLFDSNYAALEAILAEWNSPRAYATRVSNIRGTGSGPRLNGTFFLKDGITVLDDAIGDVLTGSGGMDWFFLKIGQDVVTDLKSGEFKN